MWPYRLFEFGDLPYLPTMLREGIQNFLNVSHRVMAFYRDWAPLLASVIRRTDCRQIVDLCSGGAELIPMVVAELKCSHSLDVTATMTDLYPNSDAIERVNDSEPGHQGTLNYVRTSINAMKIPAELKGIRTLFNGFHHMGPQMANAILRDAFEQRQPICVFEYNQRSLPAIASSLVYPFLVLALTPLARPLRWWQFVLTYIIPVFPIIIAWDGLVSNLRCYTLNEFQALTKDLSSSKFHWEMGTIRTWRYPIGLTYLIGAPCKADGAENHRVQGSIRNARSAWQSQQAQT